MGGKEQPTQVHGFLGFIRSAWSMFCYLFACDAFKRPFDRCHELVIGEVLYKNMGVRRKGRAKFRRMGPGRIGNDRQHRHVLDFRSRSVSSLFWLVATR
jgi:hypothetical protein